jgi:hypothetical protein
METGCQLCEFTSSTMSRCSMAAAIFSANDAYDFKASRFVAGKADLAASGNPEMRQTQVKHFGPNGLAENSYIILI